MKSADYIRKTRREGEVIVHSDTCFWGRDTSAFWPLKIEKTLQKGKT